jgi:hypothetical protein
MGVCVACGAETKGAAGLCGPCFDAQKHDGWRPTPGGWTKEGAPPPREVLVIVTVKDATATTDEAVRRGVQTAMSNGYQGYATFTVALEKP